MKATSGNHPNWGDSGVGRGCYNQKSRCNALVSALKKALLVFGVVLLVSAACIGSAKATTTTFYVASVYDDAQEVGYGTGSDIWDNSGGFVEVDRRSATSTRVSSGFRFSGITIPKGSTINSATFKPYLSTAVNDDLWCRIYGDKVQLL